MPTFKCTNCGPNEPCIIEIEMKPRICVISHLTIPEWVESEQKETDLEINGQKMPKDTYDIIRFLDGSIKIKAVYHDQPGFFKEDE